MITDTTKLHQAVRAYFGVYRRFVFLLESGTVPREELKPMPGYENAGDPDNIHAPGFSFSGSPIQAIDGKLVYMDWFVKDTKHVVSRLPNYQRDIVRKQFMGKEQLSNEDAYNGLYKDGWFVSFRHFGAQKAEAMDALADALYLQK